MERSANWHGVEEQRGTGAERKAEGKLDESHDDGAKDEINMAVGAGKGNLTTNCCSSFAPGDDAHGDVPLVQCSSP